MRRRTSARDDTAAGKTVLRWWVFADDVIGAFVHDFHTHFSAARGYTKLVREGRLPAALDAGEALDRTLEMFERMDQELDKFRVITGSHGSADDLDVKTCCETALAWNRHVLASYEVGTSVHVPDDLNNVRGDARRFTAALYWIVNVYVPLLRTRNILIVASNRDSTVAIEVTFDRDADKRHSTGSDRVLVNELRRSLKATNLGKLTVFRAATKTTLSIAMRSSR